MPEFPELLPFPDKTEAKLALLLARIARQDLRAARLLYSNELFPQAVYHTQQAVEKAVKSFGLMLRLVKVNQLKSIRHRTVFVLLVRVEGFATYLGRSLDFATSTQDETFQALRALGWGPVLQRARQIFPSSEALRRDRALVEKLESRVMWEATLNLSRDNEAVASALDVLKKPGLDGLRSAIPIDVLEEMGRLLNANQEILGYYLGMIRASPRAWALSLLTMWHENSTRYPPTSALDYWKYGQYTKDKPLLKRLPMLTRHTQILCDSVFKSAKAAVKLKT